MTWADLRLRLRALLFRDRMERELDEELQQHVELETRKLVRAGIPVEEARRQARVSFGGVEQTKEVCRDSRRVTWLTDLSQDVSYAFRTFRRTPGFVAVIVLMLGFGIGINTAVFGVVNAILLKMLPVRDPGTLFRTVPVSAQAGDIGNAVSYRMFREMQRRTKPLADLMAYQLPHKTAVSWGRSQAQYLEHQVVSGNYFSVLGVKAVVGRMIDPADGEEPGKHPIAVISSSLWNDRFQGSPHVIGKKLQLNGRTFDIIGVAPSRFFGVEVGAIVDVWTPVSMAPLRELNDEHLGWLQLMGRRKPQVSLAQATAPLQAVWEAAMMEDVRLHAPPGTPKQVIERFLAGTRLKGVPAGGGISNLRRQYGRPLQIVMFIVALVLLIACTNAASLMIARGSGRQREMAVRQSLGAGRLRLLRQLLTESALLAFLSGALGLLISHWATPVIVLSLAPGDSTVELAIRTDARILGFTFGVAFLTVLVFGLFPALRLSRVDVHSSLQSGARQTIGGRSLAGRALLVSQFAVSFVLLVGSVLFTRTLWNLMSSNLGFNPQHVLVADLADAGSRPEEKLLAAWSEVLREVKRLPGVEACSLSSSNLFSGHPRALGVRVTEPATRPADPTSDLLAISSGYFRTMGIRLKTGRGLGPGDRNSSSPDVAIVNESFAHKFFGNADPIGSKITRLYDKPQWVEIIGVVQNTKVNSLRKTAPPVFYIPYEHMAAWFPPQMQPGRTLSLQVRGRQDANTLTSFLRKRFRNEFTVQQITTQHKLIDDTLTTEKLLAEVSNLFGGLSLALTALGLYGVMSYAVTTRRQEIGIRMALGARPGRMLALVLRESATTLFIGLPLGLAAALASTHAVRSLLYGVPPNGWATFAIVGAMLLVVSLLAAFIPAYRAANIDPAIALRYE